MWTRALMVGLLFCSTLALTGCGGSTQNVEIKVMNGSQPFNPATEGDLAVALSLEAGAGPSFNKMTDETGTVNLDGVPNGKYVVAVNRYPKAGVDSGKKKGSSGSWGGSKKLGEVWEISSSNKSFTVDISKLK